jgi:hypothetical protein
MISNAQRLNAAVAIALTNTDFMGNTPKVDKAIEALTPKSTVSATFKRLQGNAKKDFLDKKDAGHVGYTEDYRAEKIKEYVKSKFQTHMDSPKTSDEATKLFYDAYPTETAAPATEAEEV